MQTILRLAAADWHFQQAPCFQQAAAQRHTFVIAHDHESRSGNVVSKFASFPLPPLPGQRFADDIQHAYELIRTEAPRFAAFDLDIQDVTPELEAVRTDPSAFLEQIRAAGEAVFNSLFIDGKVTGNMQVASSHVPAPGGKLSFHIRLPYVLENHLSCKIFAMLMLERLPRYMWPMIDMRVYSCNRQMRMLGMAKFGDLTRVFVPVPGYSTEVCDHLWGAYGETTLRANRIVDIPAPALRSPEELRLTDAQDLALLGALASALPQLSVPRLTDKDTWEEVGEALYVLTRDTPNSPFGLFGLALFDHHSKRGRGYGDGGKPRGTGKLWLRLLSSDNRGGLQPGTALKKLKDFAAADPTGGPSSTDQHAAEDYLLGLLASRGLRRHNGYIFAERLTPDGAPTASWLELSSIEEFILTELSLDGGAPPGLTRAYANTKQFRAGVLDYLTTGHFPTRFPDLNRRRNMWSFDTGLYDCETGKFTPYGGGQPLPDCVATKYIPGVFEAEWASADFPFQSIPTPVMDSLLAYQGHTGLALDVIYGMLGRSHYEVGQHDDWQVVPFFNGKPGTGKSTIVNYIIRKFYDAADVGVLSAAIEPNYPLQALYKCLIVLGPEMTAGVASRLDRTTYQSMISGGDCIIVAIKHKLAVNLPSWNIPMVLAGNEFPAYSDTQGSVLRRTFPIPHNIAVRQEDGTIKARLAAELPAAIVKLDRAYRWLLGEVGPGGIARWPSMPASLKAAHADAASAMDPIHGFLTSGACELAPGNDEVYVPLRDFKDAYKKYVFDTFHNPREVASLTPEVLKTFDRYDLKVAKNTRQRYPRPDGPMRRCAFIYGVDMIRETVFDDVEMEDPEEPAPDFV